MTDPEYRHRARLKAEVERERARVLAALEAELRSFEGEQTGRRRVVTCNPSVVHHLRTVVASLRTTS